MTDDIVTRLREYGKGVWCICGAPSNYDCSCDPFDTITARAADEIERLHIELKDWQKIARYLYDSVSVYGEICPCDWDHQWCGIHAFDDKVKAGFKHEEYKYD